MKTIYKVFRALVVTCVVLAVLLPATLYVLLSSSWMQNILRQIAEEELSALMGTDVSIGSVDYQLFDKIAVSDVTVMDDYGRDALKLGRIDAAFELRDLIVDGRFVFDYAIVNNPDIWVYRETKDSPLNIADIVEHLRSKEEKKEPTRFDIALYTVEVRGGRLRYDESLVTQSAEAYRTFNTGHVEIDNVSLTATAPVIRNDNISVLLSSLSFTTPGGFRVDDLSAGVRYTPQNLTVANIRIDTGASHLVLGTYAFDFDSADRLKELFNTMPIDIHIGKGSYINTKDLGFFIPRLADVNRRFNITANVSATKERVNIETLDINEVTDGGFLLHATGLVDNPTQPENVRIHNLDLDIRTYAPSITDFAARLNRPLPYQATNILDKMGKIEMSATVQGDLSRLTGHVDVATAIGSAIVKGEVVTPDRFKSFEANADITLSDIDVVKVVPDSPVTGVSTRLSGRLAYRQGQMPVCDIDVDQTSAIIEGYALKDFAAHFRLDENKEFDGTVSGQVDRASLTASFNGSASKERPRLAAKVDINNLNPVELRLTDRYPGYELNANLDMDLTGVPGKWVNGYLNIDNFSFATDNADKPSLRIDRLHLMANNAVRPNVIEISSDFLNGTIQGNISLFNIARQVRDIVAPSMPVIFGNYFAANSEADNNAGKENDFRFDLELDHAENLIRFFNVPVEVITPIGIEGRVDSKHRLLSADIDAPYLLKDDMILDQTSVHASFDGFSRQGDVYLTTHFPTKKGDMALYGGITAHNDTLKSEINWEIERDKPINGTLAFNTILSHDVDRKGKMCAQIDFVPCQLNFGGDKWEFSPATIIYKPGELTVKDFELSSLTQNIRIDGTCLQDDPESEIRIDLDNVVLITIFETLDIDKALIGGYASGTLHAGGLLSGRPFATCDNLHVRDIGYNYCTLGDGDIKAEWDNNAGALNLDAVITQEGGHKSTIKGSIQPATEELDITFMADKIKVGFMKPFMEAFADDITGYASGRARLFGTFKYIDLEGDVLAQDLGLKVGFTNTWYYATDSIHIRPGIIDIANVTVRDVAGNAAMLNGFVKHSFFKDPVFDFNITDAHNFLCYDVNNRINPDWYGKIFGNGSAFIKGSPGVVNIDVDMATAPGSTFTFVLSDMEEAVQYNFLTFRDKTPQPEVDSLTNRNLVPEAVLAIRDRLKARKDAENPPSAYNMNIQMDITPDARIILVMDPVGGDEIKAWGNGNLRMTYTSVGEELRMYGSYTIDRGSYNFTLQDIIVKDFTIEDGSSITFTGDPYNATLDIKAAYSVTANLSDLDESFLSDHELNRTTVPVKAILMVKGDMRQPDIGFDLEFPTLSNDIYRKVRSIVSTDEMMNSQIIYLLALNRFYTPEYMAATKGNELFSVASSTISSRLSSMLGKLSENWSIAPNLRSDRGDFSDVQFDLALSSNLLNNRLRMNGNFGYRDKSLNTTQFIGDFDLEYLLNRTGTWRLKAYNRFNDQTYFLRTAKTTQGVGISFQRDFDNLLDIFGTRRKDDEKKAKPTNPADSLKTK